MPDELSPAHNNLVGQFGLESLHWEKIMGRVSTDQEVKFLFAQLDRPTTNQSNVLAPIHSHVKTLCRSHRRLKHREAALAQRGASASGVTGTKPCSDLLDQRVILLALPGGSASLQCPLESRYMALDHTPPSFHRLRGELGRLSLVRRLPPGALAPWRDPTASVSSLLLPVRHLSGRINMPIVDGSPGTPLNDDSTVWKDAAAAQATVPTAGLRCGAGALAARLRPT
ncbi:unnamed protein product [Pleuronectes platessa]|uniref:Uncharacterized protein n=1 Tax=Pleuronectes platessa TaxID=8262 RepID=A0A9N7Y6R1_PLEPL|nr:unnamed protein product [Pleuronectes platessa]